MEGWPRQTPGKEAGVILARASWHSTVRSRQRGAVLHWPVGGCATVLAEESGGSVDRATRHGRPAGVIAPPTGGSEAVRCEADLCSSSVSQSLRLHCHGLDLRGYILVVGAQKADALVLEASRPFVFLK